MFAVNKKRSKKRSKRELIIIYFWKPDGENAIMTIIDKSSLINPISKNCNQKLLLAYYIIQKSFNYVKAGAKYELYLSRQSLIKKRIDERLKSYEPIYNLIKVDYPLTVIEKYYARIENDENKTKLINLTLIRFEEFVSKFNFRLVLMEMFPDFNEIHLKKMESYFYEGLYEMQKYGYITSVGYSKKRKVDFISRHNRIDKEIDTRGFKLSDEYIRLLFRPFFNGESKKDKTPIYNSWLPQCSQINGVSSVLVLKLFCTMTFLMSKRTKYFNNQIAWLSYKNLSNMTGMTQNGILNHINLLRDNGILYSRSQWDKHIGKFYKNMYSLPKNKEYLDYVFDRYVEKLKKRRMKKLQKEIAESDGEF